ncbi:UNVERIFIED_CONTAM: hypothetical protein NCL1_26169 [Trichonephila clavipes]
MKTKSLLNWLLFLQLEKKVGCTHAQLLMTSATTKPHFS